MSKEQWGHGYHVGMEKAKENVNNKSSFLVGKWAHILRNGKINNQVQIVKETDGMVLVQYYSFLDGCATNQSLIPIGECQKWKFYNSDLDMRDAFDREN